MNGKRDAVVVWDDLRVFLAVARAGTLSGAAGRLALGVATVSRRVERLEAVLGQPLFLRHQSGYRLTEDGRALLPRAEEMEAAARALGTGAEAVEADGNVTGQVRLATAEGLATDLILPALPELRARHPGLTIDLLTDIATVNINRRDADLALRMVKPIRGHVALQRLGTLGMGIYAAQSYLDRRARPAEETEFGADAFITWSEDQAHLAASRWIERQLRGRRPVLTTTSLATQVAACAAGVGLAVLPHFMARPRGLVCLAADPGADQAIWLVTQSDLLRARRVQAVAAFCRALVRDHAAALARP